MLGHRKLTVDDYLAILKRRRWLIAIPMVLLPIIAYSITFFIPAQYLSQTLVLIEDQKVPEDIARSVMSTSLESRLASMREQILSRTRIQPIIERYNLYAGRHLSMDDRVDLTRKAISIKPIRSDIANRGGLPGFFIAFVASDPRTAQMVCGDITSLFVAENLQSREATAEGTTEFLKSQLEEAKHNLDEQDAKLAAFQVKNFGKLPGQEAPNVNMLTSVSTQLEGTNQALAHMQEQKDYAQSLLAQQLQNAPTPTSTGSHQVAPAVEQAQLDSLLAQESELTAHYTADYPDVIAVRRKISDLRKKMAEAPAPAPVASAPNAIAPPSRNDSPVVQQLRAQIRALDAGIQDKKKEQDQIQGNMRIFQDRINSSPEVGAQYKDLTRDYNTAQQFYDGLLMQMNHSKMATDLERRQQGEQFRVMDEPNLPEAPTYPNRQLFAAAGLVGGFVLGLLIAAFLEYKDTSLRTEQDVWAFTRLPTLAVIAYSGDLEIRHRKPGMFSRLGNIVKRKPPTETLSKAQI